MSANDLSRNNAASRKILAQLSNRQREAVTYTDGHLLVLAGAGSGKTRVLTCKVAWLISEEIAKANEILAVTFTNKAAGEMRSRINNLVPENYAEKIQVGTFHGFGLRFLFRHQKALREIAKLKENFTVFDRADSRKLIQDIMTEMKLSTKVSAPAGILEAIARDYMDWSITKTDSNLEGSYLVIGNEYRKRLRELNAVDFDDLMILPLEILSQDSEIRHYEQERLNWILVDEYQDVNRPQYLLLKYIAGENCIVNVVGDPDQAIYGWRGADVNMILNFEKDFRDATRIVLDENYRSTGCILRAANSLILNNTHRFEKNLRTARESGEKIYNLIATTDYQEADFIVREIERLHSRYGYAYKDIALLYRQNAMSRLYEQKFLQAGVPYRIVRGLGFYDRMEVKDVLSILRFALNPFDFAALERVADFAIDGMGKKRCNDFEEWLSDLREKSGDNPSEIWSLIAGGAWKVSGKIDVSIRNFASHMCALNEIAEKGIIRAVDYVLEDLAYEEYLHDKDPESFEDRLDNVQELKSVLPKGNLAQSLAEAALYTDADTQDSGLDSVCLSTLHAAKGLEYPVVFIVGLEENIFPHSRSKEDPAELEEERRLFYVGITRAEERLYLTSAHTRHLYGKPAEHDVSVFLLEIPDNLKRVDDRNFDTRGFVFRSSRKNYDSNSNNWGSWRR